MPPSKKLAPISFGPSLREKQEAIREQKEALRKKGESDVEVTRRLQKEIAKQVERLSPADEWLEMPEDCAYGKAAEIARSLGIPLTRAYTCVVTVGAGVYLHLAAQVDRDRLGIQESLFSIVLGPPEDGKSRSITRSIWAVTGEQENGFIYEVPPASSRGLIEMFKIDKELLNNNIYKAIPAPPALLSLEEMGTLLSKMRIKGSDLGDWICKLWDRCTIGASDKKGMIIGRVRLSILAGLPIQTEEDFREEMADEVSRGLFTRVNLVPPLKPGWTMDKSWTPYIEPVASPTSPHMSDEIVAMVTKWQAERDEEGPSRNRAGENAIRIAFITAGMNQDKEVSRECMQAALNYMTWQEKVKARYGFSSAKTPSALITEAIILEAEQHVDETGYPQMFNFAKVAKNKRWYKWGSLVSQAKAALVNDGVLVEDWYLDEDAKRNKRSGYYSISHAYLGRTGTKDGQAAKEDTNAA